MVSVERIYELLKDNGYKLTPQRKAIIDALVNHMGRFITAEEIHNEVKKQNPKTNFSTIYRNLEVFEIINIIHRTNMSDTTSLYELICHDDHHHHIICKSCGKTEIIDFCPLKSIDTGLIKNKFTLTDHKFEIYGFCENCKKQRG